MLRLYKLGNIRVTKNKNKIVIIPFSDIQLYIASW